MITTAPLPFGRHPDHRAAAELVRDACFLPGFGKLRSAPPHRPRKVLHAITYREDYLKPTFVVDMSAEFETEAGSDRLLRARSSTA